MKLSLLPALLATAATASYWGGPCEGRNGKLLGLIPADPGICIPKGDCRGHSEAGFCPGTPDEVWCCSLGCNGNKGDLCQWTSGGCAGVFVSGQCPGDSGFKCCIRGAQAARDVGK